MLDKLSQNFLLKVILNLDQNCVVCEYETWRFGNRMSCHKNCVIPFGKQTEISYYETLKVEVGNVRSL